MRSCRPRLRQVWELEEGVKWRWHQNIAYWYLCAEGTFSKHQLKVQSAALTSRCGHPLQPQGRKVVSGAPCRGPPRLGHISLHDTRKARSKKFVRVTPFKNENVKQKTERHWPSVPCNTLLINSICVEVNNVNAFSRRMPIRDPFLNFVKHDEF